MSTMTESPPSTITPSAFRAAMRRLPTTVVVVGGLLEGQPVGMVIGTFTSVSSEPLLVGFLGDDRSSSLASILKLDRVSFNALDEDDAETPFAFAGPMEERFNTVEWHKSEYGTPVIDSSVLTVHAQLGDAVRAGDHHFITAEVLSVEAHHPTRRPLVYVESRMTRLDPWQQVSLRAWQLGWD